MSALDFDRKPSGYIPQTTLALPPEDKLSPKLADKAVHDCSVLIVGSYRILYTVGGVTYI